MAWTSKVTAISKGQGQIKIAVEYTDGTEVLGDTFVSNSPIDMLWLRRQVKNRIDMVTQNYAFADTLAVNQAIDTSPIAVPPLAQAEIDYVNFSKWMNLTVALNAAKGLGWITGNEQIVTDAKNKVIALAGVNMPRMFL